MTDVWFQRSCSGATSRVDASDVSEGVGSLASVRGSLLLPFIAFGCFTRNRFYLRNVSDVELGFE